MRLVAQQTSPPASWISAPPSKASATTRKTTWRPSPSSWGGRADAVRALSKAGFRTSPRASIATSRGRDRAGLSVRIDANGSVVDPRRDGTTQQNDGRGQCGSDNGENHHVFRRRRAALIAPETGQEPTPLRHLHSTINLVTPRVAISIAEFAAERHPAVIGHAT